MLRNQLRPAIVLTLVLCVLTGVIYPGVVTALAQVIFPRQANGSLVIVNGRVVGSELMGQTFTRPYYFHSRPSAAGAGYDGCASHASLPPGAPTRRQCVRCWTGTSKDVSSDSSASRG